MVLQNGRETKVFFLIAFLQLESELLPHRYMHIIYQRLPQYDERRFTLHATWRTSPFEDGVACPQHTIDHMKVSRVDLCYHFSDETGPLVRKIFSTYYTDGIAEL